MSTLRVRVENGKIVGDAPPGLEEGAELELSLVDPGDEMDEAELAALNRALEQAWRSVTEGQVRPVEDVLTDLRGRR